MNAGRLSGNRLGAALAAGGIAIVLNTIALQTADLLPLETARGGLLRLIRPVLSIAVDVPSTRAFQTLFHLFVGILMALFYAYVLESRLPGRPLVKGILYAAATWALNALVILPATGEGFAGSRHLSLAGMTWFAAAHTIFFVALALLYTRLKSAVPGREIAE